MGTCEVIFFHARNFDLIVLLHSRCARCGLSSLSYLFYLWRTILVHKKPFQYITKQSEAYAPLQSPFHFLPFDRFQKKSKENGVHLLLFSLHLSSDVINYIENAFVVVCVVCMYVAQKDSWQNSRVRCIPSSRPDLRIENGCGRALHVLVFVFHSRRSCFV